MWPTRAPAPERYLGVDLAWGMKAPTGLAVLDADGRLLDVARVHTDDEIQGWITSWSGSSCLVAIDAPIIVPNATGRRACETLVSRYFGRYNAGAHSSNRSLPAFRDGVRAQRLAEAWGLDVDPSSTSSRRAIEVYPHPAIVTLFGLDAVLQYKGRSRRSLDTRRSELLRLIGYLDALATSDPALATDDVALWMQIRSEVQNATRPVDLERVEDEVDAVVCAYIALFATRTPHRVRVLGDVERGYILTPVTAEMARRIDADRAAGATASAPGAAPKPAPRPAPSQDVGLVGERPGQAAATSYVVVLSSAGMPRRAGGPFADERSALAWAGRHSGPEEESTILPLG